MIVASKRSGRGISCGAIALGLVLFAAQADAARPRKPLPAGAAMPPLAPAVIDDTLAIGGEEIAARKQDRVSDSSKSQTTAAELVSLASPQPVITVDGKLDVSPNAKFDVPVLGHDLPALPIRQQRVIGVILSDLPSQSPRHLKPPLEYYRDELEARGTQPILGILKDMADIIEAACAANDGEWLEAGLRKSFDIFIANHAVLMEHFPFDIEREQRYAEINVDEDAVVGAEFVKPFEEAEAMVRASNAVTADTVLVVERMREIAEITAYIPPAHRNFLDPKDIVPNYGDRLGNLPVSVSVKKRLILQARGFWEGCKPLLQKAGVAADWIYKIGKLIEWLSKLFPPTGPT